MMDDELSCPCDSGATYGQCCRPLLEGTAVADTAQQLMRSRYTANVVHATDYLRNSWHSSTRPADTAPAVGVTWRRLRIRDTVDGGIQDSTGEVEFVAHFRTADGSRDFLHERSRFTRQAGRWVYVDGEVF